MASEHYKFKTAGKDHYWMYFLSSWRWTGPLTGHQPTSCKPCRPRHGHPQLGQIQTSSKQQSSGSSGYHQPAAPRTNHRPEQPCAPGTARETRSNQPCCRHFVSWRAGWGGDHDRAWWSAILHRLDITSCVSWPANQWGHSQWRHAHAWRSRCCCCECLSD